MANPSSPSFRTLHSLRIKGFATVDTLVDMTGEDPAVVQQHLDGLAAAERAQFREARGLWQLTAAGRESHAADLRADVAGVLPNADLDEAYGRFLAINGQFKELCGAWQLFNGQPNDHSSAEYDAAVIENLSHLHASAEPTIKAFGEVLDRMAGYGPRLESVLVRILDGESNMFTGVMCGSYHDVWMELHEDLILTKGLDRAAEGSF
jgi:hypothetical protein